MKYIQKNEDKNYNYLFHDTFDSTKHYPVKRIFDYRINQDKTLVGKKKCLIFNKCSSSQYTNYETCRESINKDATGTFEIDSNDPCLFSNRYAQRLKYAPMKSIACIAMHTPGPHTPKPKKQDESFLCMQMAWSQFHQMIFHMLKEYPNRCN